MSCGPNSGGSLEKLFATLEEPLKPRLRFDAADPPKPYAEQSEEEKQRNQDYYR